VYISHTISAYESMNGDKFCELNEINHLNVFINYAMFFVSESSEII